MQYAFGLTRNVRYQRERRLPRLCLQLHHAIKSYIQMILFLTKCARTQTALRLAY